MLANVLRLPVETSPQSQGISGYVASVAKKIWTNKANANTVVVFFFFFPLWSCRVWLVLPARLVPRCQCCLCILCSRRNAACGSIFLKQEHCLLSSERAVGEWGRQRSCVPRQFYVVCLWWKMGWFAKGREERADVNTGESMRAEMTLAHFSPESNQVLLVYLV